MSKNQQGSVAPKERINIVYKPATGDAKEAVELPFKVMVLGDFTHRADNRTVEEREPVSVNNQNFNDVMASMNLSLNFAVENKLTNDSKSDIDISLNLNKLSDFDPDSVVKAVPELAKVLQLREALKSLKGPLGNTPAMRRMIQDMLSDGDLRARLMAELGIDKSAA
jgi:type VI secretion system protein ImpB